MKSSFLDQILNRPDAPIIAGKLNHELQKEKRRRSKFHDWVTPDVKAEFINGEIVVHSPVTLVHEKSSNNLNRMLCDFVLMNDLGYVAHEKLMISLTRNDYEPDICYFTKEKSSIFTDEMNRFPAPDFIVEVLSKSTCKADRGIKFQDYAIHGVQEYWLVDCPNNKVEKYILTQKDNEYDTAGIFTLGEKISCEVLPGFEILVDSIFSDKNYLEQRKLLGI